MQEMFIKQVSLHCVILILPWNTNKIQMQISWVGQSTKGKSRVNKILSRNIYLDGHIFIDEATIPTFSGHY